MKKAMAKKVLAAITAAASTMSLVACGGAKAEAPAPAPEEAPAVQPATEAPAEEG